MKEETTDLIVVLTGDIVESNLPEFKKNALAVIKAADKPLVTTQDFEDAEVTVKKCKQSEQAIVVAKEKALNQTVDIKALFETMDEISAALAKTRLSLDKKVKERKAERKSEIASSGYQRLVSAVDEVTVDLPEITNAITARLDIFSKAVGGKRKIESMEEAVEGVLELELEELERTRERIVKNKEIVSACKFPSLFPDIAQLVCKPTNEVSATVDGRAAKHKLEEKNRKEREVKAAEEKKAREAKAKKESEERLASAEVDRISPTEEQNEKEVQPDPVPETTPESEREPQAPPQNPSPQQEVHNKNEDFVLIVLLTCTTERAKDITKTVNKAIGEFHAVKKINIRRASV